MRIALISDIHANIVALEAAIADIKERGVDRIICLGDIIDMGPRPVEVIDCLRDLDVACIQGNHDPLDEKPPISPLKEVEEWTIAQLSTEQRSWLSSLPPELIAPMQDQNLLCIHGSPHSNTEGVEPDTKASILEKWFSKVDQDIIAAGHTHLPFCRHLGNKQIVNVGSIGMPFFGPLPPKGPPVILKSIDFAIVGVEMGAVDIEMIRLPLDFEKFKGSFKGTDFPDIDGWLFNWK